MVGFVEGESTLRAQGESSLTESELLSPHETLRGPCQNEGGVRARGSHRLSRSRLREPYLKALPRAKGEISSSLTSEEKEGWERALPGIAEPLRESKENLEKEGRDLFYI